jgi:hypothetical protein
MGTSESWGCQKLSRRVLEAAACGRTSIGGSISQAYIVRKLIYCV